MLKITNTQKRVFYITLLQALIEKIPSASIIEADYVIAKETKRLADIGTLDLIVSEPVPVKWSLAHGFTYEGDKPATLENV